MKNDVTKNLIEVKRRRAVLLKKRTELNKLQFEHDQKTIDAFGCTDNGVVSFDAMVEMISAVSKMVIK